MSRPTGSNKFNVYLKCARAGMMWMKGHSLKYIGKELGVSTRMVSYYLNTWSMKGNEIIEYLRSQKNNIDEYQALFKDE